MELTRCHHSVYYAVAGLPQQKACKNTGNYRSCIKCVVSFNAETNSLLRIIRKRCLHAWLCNDCERLQRNNTRVKQQRWEEALTRRSGRGNPAQLRLYRAVLLGHQITREATCYVAWVGRRARVLARLP